MAGTQEAHDTFVVVVIITRYFCWNDSAIHIQSSNTFVADISSLRRIKHAISLHRLINSKDLCVPLKKGVCFQKGEENGQAEGTMSTQAPRSSGTSVGMSCVLKMGILTMPGSRAQTHSF